jgi:hypothetical protein
VKPEFPGRGLPVRPYQCRYRGQFADAECRRLPKGSLGKAEDKRAAIIAKQAERQQAEQPNAAPMPKKRMNWAATAPVRPRRGRPSMGGAGKMNRDR